MRDDFGKIFGSMYKGSMVGKGAMVFALWPHVIANMEPDRDNAERLVVELNAMILAAVFGEPEERVRGAIEFLCAPDEGSRSKEQEGRRLVKIGEFLYWVVNGRKYRERIRTPVAMREHWREQKRRQRSRSKTGAMAAAARGREARFVKADGEGRLVEADEIAAEGLEEERF